MCTISFAINESEEFPFVLMGNRDEFYERPTSPMHWWNSEKEKPVDRKDMLAGKDLKAGGTWMGITVEGKFAAITNFRDLENVKENAPSRGHLVNDFLQSDIGPEEFLKVLRNEGPKYNGFNFLFGSVDELYYYSNYGKEQKQINNGIHGISNAFLNDPWPKVELAKKRMKDSLASGKINSPDLMQHLADQQQFSENLPETGVSEEFEKQLSAICIVTPDYGTRVSTTILVHKSGAIEVNELDRLTSEQSTFKFERRG